MCVCVTEEGQTGEKGDTMRRQTDGQNTDEERKEIGMGQDL